MSTTYYCVSCGRSCADFIPCPDCHGTLIEQITDGVSTVRNYAIEQSQAAILAHIPAARLEYFEWDGEGGVVTYHFDARDGVLEQHWDAHGHRQEGE